MLTHKNYKVRSHAIHYNGLSDLFEIAAKLAHSVAKAHAFSDGNKRTGYLVCLHFLEKKGQTITPDWEKSANAMEALVVGTISEDDFANYLYTWHENNINNNPKSKLIYTVRVLLVEILLMKEKKEIMFGVEIKQRPYIPMSEENYPTRSAKALVQAHKKALDKLAKM